MSAKTRGEVLVVDDEPAMLETLRDILEAEGFRVAVAASGREALQQARHRQFSFAVLDYRMPGLNGVETLSELRKTNPGLMAVFVTAYAVPELSRLGSEQGCHSTLTKPVHIPSLLALLREMQDMDVLLVDDDEDLCTSLRDVLQMKGYRVALAHDGPEALDMMRDRGFRAAIVDVVLPSMDGLELSQRLRDADGSLRLLLISGYPPQTEPRIQKAQEQGLAFMGKPLEIDRLLKRLGGGRDT